jgi:ribosome-associated protein
LRNATLSKGVLPETASSPQPDIGSVGSPGEATFRAILASLDDAKAEDIIMIDLRGKTALADHMIIATGRSTTHVGSIADKAIKACKSAGLASPRVEGLPQCDWVLIDASDVIVHVFRPEVRQFYNLEKMWGGDRPVEIKRV